MKRSRLSRKGSRVQKKRLKFIDKSGYDNIIFRNIKNPSVTIEAHQFDDEAFREIGARWYVFPARDGKGIPDSPDMFRTKKEAIKRVNELKEEYG